MFRRLAAIAMIGMMFTGCAAMKKMAEENALKRKQADNTGLTTKAPLYVIEPTAGFNVAV